MTSPSSADARYEELMIVFPPPSRAPFETQGEEEELMQVHARWRALVKGISEHEARLELQYEQEHEPGRLAAYTSWWESEIHKAAFEDSTLAIGRLVRACSNKYGLEYEYLEHLRCGVFKTQEDSSQHVEDPSWYATRWCDSCLREAGMLELVRASDDEQ